MSSYSKPRCPLSINHIHHLLLGFSAFIVLCGTKTLQIMNMQALKRTCAHWLIDETNQMLDLLIKNKARMGQVFSFPQSVYAEVANQLGPDKNSMMVGLKWQLLKRTWRAKTTYNSHSGCSFHVTHGADVQSQAEQEAWDAFIVTDSSESKEMSQFRNKGWLFHEKMVELCPGGSGATGAYSFTPSKTMSIDQGASGDFDNPYADLSLLPKSSAVEGMFSMLYAWLYSHAISCPPAPLILGIIFAWICFPPLPPVAAPVPPPNLHLSTSNTTLISAKILKGKAKGQTSHSKASSLSSSATASRWAKAALAEPAVALALTGMTGVLLHATDTMCKIKDLLVSSPAVPPTKAPITTPTSPDTPSNSVIHDTSGILMADAVLDPAIQAELALAFLSNMTLCQMYIDLTDPLIWHCFALSWFQKNCGTQPGTSAGRSDAEQTGTSDDPFAAYYDDQTHFM
ncbi:hypothetical protein EDD17DRAFT_1760034 [Pisolithus thermaeus]|nr:hypothetical protein EDD17DRAFT_1760034 [Pisolithus thermaeus]